jgi:hypothetical protein
MFKGSRKEASFNKIVEIKDVRNSLIHDSGKDVEELLALYPHIGYAKGDLMISAAYYDECVLALRSVALSLARDITRGKYRCA